MSTKPYCNWPLGPDGLVPFALIAGDTSDCEVPPGFRGFTLSQEIVDSHGHVLDGDYDPRGKDGCKHGKPAVKKHVKAAVAAKEKHMDNAANESPAPEVTASVGAEPMDTFNVQALAANGGANGSTVLLALIGVAGSGAVIKLVKDALKGRKELAEKKLELEEKRLEKQDENHQKCSAERLSLRIQVEKMSAQVADLGKSVSNIQSDPMSFAGADLEDFSERMERLEKAVFKKSGRK